MRARAIRCFIVAFLSCLLPGAALHAQARVVIRDSVTCRSCRITLERVLEIGGSRDPVLLTQNTRFVIAPDGRIFASPTSAPGVIAVYNNSGVQTGTLGRQGRGPGEFARVWGATLSAGRLHVIDFTGQRINVFGPSLSFEREIPLTDNLTDNDGILVIGSRIVLSSIFQTPVTGAPVVILASDGRRIRTLSPEPDSAPGTARRRYLAESVGDRFWVAPFNRYVVELWDTAGRQHTTIVRNAEWFRPWVVPTNPVRMRPQPQLKSVRQDSAGRLWVSLLVADSRWAPPPPSAQPDDPDANRLFDTRVEVIDPASASLLATLRVDGSLGKVTAPEPMFSSYEIDSNGYVIWTLYRARLQGLRAPALR